MKWCGCLSFSPPLSLSSSLPLSLVAPPPLDEGLGLGVVAAGLGVDLGVVVPLVPEAPQVSAVAQQVERQAEAQQAQHQQAHVHLGGGSKVRPASAQV